eukprot:CAMPEP_0174311902 /NCGR_PEP_ID=MMETSP0810-20121108/3980_1 /TAXON_ID=73025 ORGANISM="Eutreptiella gymnastica-like, Strain CCMP1594" /NCGR_SAMPLE_ID=MMETSP0810 /ASSEMBLY_ACC=CAM_ASM_000659 /LENGTH=257 /DNA_ID=CAMNT_0015420211 /DNA_START=32 /DNA_END=806 /DNA_ORIENTATION=-
MEGGKNTWQVQQPLLVSQQATYMDLGNHGHIKKWRLATATIFVLVAALPLISSTEQRHSLYASPLPASRVLATAQPAARSTIPLRAAVVTQITPLSESAAADPTTLTDFYPPTPQDAPSTSADLPSAQAPTQPDQVPPPSTFQTDAPKKAIEQYDFSGYSTFNNSNIDPKSFTPIILGIVVLLGGLFYFLFGFLKKNASKVGVELNPTRTRTDFTSQYRPKSVRLDKEPEDFTISSQFEEELKKRGMDDEAAAVWGA